MPGKMIHLRAMLFVVLVAVLVLLTACAVPTPQIVKETVAVEKVITQVVEKPVEKVVEKQVEVVVTATPAPKEPLKFTIYWWGDQMAEVHTQLAQEYAKTHPDFVVDFQKIEAPAYTLQFQTWFQSDSAPVLMTGGGMNADNAIKPGYLSPWDPYLELPNPYAGGQPWKDTLHMEWLVRSRYEGDSKIYFMPTFADQAGVYYNKSIFDKLGLTPPTTWDEWMAVNQKIKDAGYDAIEVGGNVVWMQGELMDALWREHAAEMFKDPNYTQVDLTNSLDDTRTQARPYWSYCSYKEGIFKVDSPQTRFMAEKMLELGKYFPEGSPELGPWGNAKLDPILLSFVNERLATWYGAGWMLPSLTKLAADLPEEKRFEVGYFTLPGWSDQPIKSPDGSFTIAPLRSATGRDASNANFALSAQATEEERLRAVDFVMFLLSPQSYSYMVKQTDVGQFPLAKDVPDLPPALQNPPKGGPAILTHGYGVGSGGEEYYIRNVELFYAAKNGELTLDEYVKEYDTLWAESIAKWEQKQQEAGTPVECRQ
jgi:ABC-type glycerol-3-phosphate transport system substrate-binding protein